MTGKRILLSLEIPDLHPWNEFSAVACVIMSMAQVLEEEGHEVYINEFPFRQIENKKEIAGASGTPSPYSKIIPKRIREAVKDMLLLRKIGQQRRRVSQIPRPDIIISWLSYASHTGAALKAVFNTPLVVIFDNFMLEEYRLLHGFEPVLTPLLKARERRMLRAADAMIAYAPAVAEKVRSENKLDLVAYIKPFIDSRKINYLPPREKPGKLRLLYIGSFFKWHKLEELIDLFTELASKDDNVELVMVGDGPELQQVQLRAGSSPAADRIVFMGRMGKDALTAVLETSHVGIIPSAMWFHAPLKLFQYAAAGLVVLSTATPVITYLSRGYTDGVQLFSNRDEFLDRVDHLQRNRDRLVQFAGEARRFMEENYEARHYASFFREIIHKTTSKLG